MTEAKAIMDKGYPVFFHEGVRYEVLSRTEPGISKKFKKLVRDLYKDGKVPFETIRVGGKLFAVNPKRNATNSLIEIPLLKNGTRGKTGEEKLKKIRIQMYQEQEEPQLENIIVDNDVYQDAEFDVNNGAYIAKKHFETNIRGIANIRGYLTDKKTKLGIYLNNAFTTFGTHIIRIRYTCGLATGTDPGKPNTYTLNGEKHIILNADESKEVFDTLYDVFLKLLDDLEGKKSGLTLSNYQSTDVFISKYEPPTAGSYKPLPEKIANKRCCVNVKNDDDKCLLWSIASALYPVKEHPERTSHYDISKIKCKNVRFPSTLNDVKKVEEQNDLAINVYGLDKGQATQIYHSERKGRVINLLWADTNHFCWIKNFNRFMGCSNNKKTKNRDKKVRKYFCDSCGFGFWSPKKLQEHKDNGCEAQFVRYPPKGQDICKFNSLGKMIEHPLCIYADFESALKLALKQASQKTKNTEVLQEHDAIGCGFQVICRGNDKLNEYRSFVGNNAHDWFIDHLIQKADEYSQFLNVNTPYALSEEERLAFEMDTQCHLCGGSFSDTDELRKVCDHNHVTGKYRGPAHNKCNLLLRMPNFVPVVFHNLTGYDGQYILNSLCRGFANDGWEISVIAVSGEKFKSISFTKRYGLEKFTYRFIDSFAFLSSSLDVLAKNLRDSDKHFTRSAYPDQTKFNLVNKKGFLPYDVIDSLEALQMKQLPAFKDLKPVMGEIDEEHYNNGLKVWEEFGCSTLQDYLEIYLKTDVLLLADVFETFRNLAMRDYRLEPLHYISLPSFAWDAMLLKTKVELQLITDPDMFNMIERSKRGGVSFIAHRHAKANNPYIAGYDPKKRKTYLMYLDANNLYGWAMCKPLPVDGFKFAKVMTVEELMAIDVDGKTGYFIECDLEYPTSLHLSHSLLPLAPENVKVRNDELSDYQKLFESKEEEKLCTNLKDKKNYVLHIRNFQQYVKLGMKCTAVKRVISFNQKPFMEPYIMDNTRFRAKAKNDFEKDFYKLMNNAVFGKTMENVKNRIETVFTDTDDATIKKMVQKPTYTGFFDKIKNTAMFVMEQRQVLLNKPIAVGCAVLDISKTLMYDFHYNVMLKKYGVERLRLCMTDTDSLLYWIATEDVYEDMRGMKEWFDNSEYPKNDINYDETNKKVLGKFKNEEAKFEDKPNHITEFCGHRSKLYAYQTAIGGQEVRAKGTEKSVAKTIQFSEYLRTLETGEEVKKSMTCIRSTNHNLQTIRITKKALCAFDDKRYLVNNVFSVPHGYRGDWEVIHASLINIWTC